MDSNFWQKIISLEDRATVFADVRILEDATYRLPDVSAFEHLVGSMSFMYGKPLLAAYQTAINKLTFIQELRAGLADMQVVELQLGFNPTIEQMQRLALKVKQQWGERSLVQITVRRELMGGITVAVGGRYLDLSLKPLVDAYWEAHKDQWLTRLGITV